MGLMGCEQCGHEQGSHYDGGCRVCDDIGEDCDGYRDTYEGF
jgi:hypothetical protein